MKSFRLFGQAIILGVGIVLASPIVTVPGTDLSFANKAAAQSYRYMTCGELWYARNAIYARQGYCFKTQRARRTFGARCYAPWGRLTPSQQRQVNRVIRWERNNGCR